MRSLRSPLSRDSVRSSSAPANSSFGTPSPRSGRPSPLHECLQFRVAAASEAANRNVGFTEGFRMPALCRRTGPDGGRRSKAS
jgi:hypothetical protein